MRALALFLLTSCGAAATSGTGTSSPEPVSASTRFAEAEHAWAAGMTMEAEAILVELGQDPLSTPDERLRAWWRLADLHFEVGALDRAELEYARVVGSLDAREPRRGLVTYKWGWTAYRDDRYADALERFALVLEAELPPEHVLLHDEALTYLVILVAEADWDADGAPDPQVGLERPEVARWLAQRSAAPWRAQFYEALAETYDDQMLPDLAVDARRRALTP